MKDRYLACRHRSLRCRRSGQPQSTCARLPLLMLEPRFRPGGTGSRKRKAPATTGAFASRASAAEHIPTYYPYYPGRPLPPPAALTRGMMISFEGIDPRARPSYPTRPKASPAPPPRYARDDDSL